MKEENKRDNCNVEAVQNAEKALLEKRKKGRFPRFFFIPFSGDFSEKDVLEAMRNLDSKHTYMAYTRLDEIVVYRDA